jgi:hypothetical protein
MPDPTAEVIAERELRITLLLRPGGGLRICSDQAPGLVLSGFSPTNTLARLWPVVLALRGEGRDPFALAARAQAGAGEGLRDAVAEFLAAEDEVEREAARAEAKGGLGWSSAPIVRRIHAVTALRALSAAPQPPPTQSGEGDRTCTCDWSIDTCAVHGLGPDGREDRGA